MFRYLFGLAVTVLLAFAVPTTTRAGVEPAPRFVDSPYDLINAVNGLRASYGLAPYAISSILMSTAQNQADYMAATGSVSHTGAGGASVTDRLLAAGYPLAGDLSLGGFRSENITAGGESSTAQGAVHQWSGDAIHLDTMISPNLAEIGAGISENGGKVYYVIDCALPTYSGQPQGIGTSDAIGSPVPAGGGVIVPVILATPDSEGNLIHVVRAGQSLWQIAISYNTKIDEIKRLNNLPDNNIYPGNKLQIRQGVETPSLAVETSITEPTLTVMTSPTSLAIPPAAAITSISTDEPLSTSRNGIPGVVMGILAVALLGGALVAWMGTSKK